MPEQNTIVGFLALLVAVLFMFAVLYSTALRK
jgi:hypothetical protein